MATASHRDRYSGASGSTTNLTGINFNARTKRIKLQGIPKNYIRKGNEKLWGKKFTVPQNGEKHEN